MGQWLYTVAKDYSIVTRYLNTFTDSFHSFWVHLDHFRPLDPRQGISILMIPPRFIGDTESIIRQSSNPSMTCSIQLGSCQDTVKGLFSVNPWNKEPYKYSWNVLVMAHFRATNSSLSLGYFFSLLKDSLKHIQ